MTFANPTALILLLALPFIWYIGFPRYKFRRRRDVTSLVLRSLIVLCLVFAVAGAQIVRDVERLAVVFLVDASDSMGSAALEQQVAFIREAVTDKPIDDEWAIIVFGANNRPEASFSALEDVPDIQSRVLQGNTDIAAAIQTAIAIFPADATRRIVILSDGQETLGNAESKARLAQAAGIEISYVPYTREFASDVRVLRVDTPVRVAEGQDFDIGITVESEAATDASLLIFSGVDLIEEQRVTLQQGITRYTLTRTAPESGFLNFSARIIPDGDDNFVQNNAYAAFSEVIGPARVLLVRNDPAEAEHILPALENAGVNVDVTTPNNVPADVSGLADYKSIMIINVPADDFSTRQMQVMDRYVSDLGGGLVFVGGPDSYGPGEYYDTPLERTLPVEMQIRDQERLPQLTIVYLIDRSGSMAQTDANGISNIELAKSAINRSIDFLQPTDRAGVNSFDTGGSWVATIQDVNDKRQLQLRVATLRSGGGTDILAGLRSVTRRIGDEPSERKHLILLTDGGANPNGLIAQTETLNQEYDTTLSVVVMGSLKPGFLQQMANVGGGNYHEVDDVSDIPRIFAQETVLIARTFIEEGTFTPRLTSASPIMADLGAPPNLNGYVATTPKDTAQVILRGPEPFADPLLASWQYGLGRVVAFTSDATSRWATEWIAWENFTRFWAQTISWTITESAVNNVETRITMLDDRARVLIDAREDDDSFLNNLNLEASVLAPDNSTAPMRLQQIAPGLYEGTFTPTSEGTYFVSVNGRGQLREGTPINFNEVNGWVMSYSQEYIQTTPNTALLRDISDLTGGASLSDNPVDAFARTSEPRTAAAPIAPYLLLLALILLPFDIAVRRLIITRTDLQRLWAYFSREPAPVGPDERVSVLLGARDRVRQRQQQTGGTISALRQRKAERESPADDAATPPASPKTSPRPQPTAPRSTSGDDSTVGNLLKRRRQRDEDDS